MASVSLKAGTNYNKHDKYDDDNIKLMGYLKICINFVNEFLYKLTIRGDIIYEDFLLI